MIGTGCRVGGFDNEVVPPGQAGASSGDSFVRALQSTGIISSIVSTPTLVTVNFDLSKPSSKYKSAGFALRIPNASGLESICCSTFVSSIYVDTTNGTRAWISYSGFNMTTPTTPGHVFEVTYDPATGTSTWSTGRMTWRTCQRPISSVTTRPATFTRRTTSLF